MHKDIKKADLEGSLAVLHSEQAASLTPSRYILLVESGPIDTTESVLWPNRERRTCTRTNVETSRYCIGLQLFVQLAPNTTVGDAVIRTGLAKRNSSSNGDKY